MSVAIIGAGLSGLVAAKKFKEHGREVTIFEKGRSPGGRLATRRFEGGIFDHGAQLFHFESDKLTWLIDFWQDKEALKEWGDAFCGRNSMTNLAKALASELNVNYEEKLILMQTQLERRSQEWGLLFESGRREIFDQVLFTAPVPQCLDILKASSLQLSPTLDAELAAVRYKMCLVGLFTLDGPSGLEKPGWLEFEKGPIASLTDNSMKGVSPTVSAVTVQMNHDFSAEYFEADESSTLKAIADLTAPVLHSKIVHGQLKKWRYALVQKSIPRPYEQLLENLWIAGDAFHASEETPTGGFTFNIQTAALSGLLVAAEMMK